MNITCISKAYITVIFQITIKCAVALIAVCVYRLLMISIDLSETTQKSTLEIQDKIQSETKFSPRQNLNFFSDNYFFFQRKFVSD